MLISYKKTTRYLEAKQIQTIAEEKYGAKNITTIGHSQGGVLAELVGKNTPIITYNKMTSYGVENKIKQNQLDIRTKQPSATPRHFDDANFKDHTLLEETRVGKSILPEDNKANEDAEHKHPSCFSTTKIACAHGVMTRKEIQKPFNGNEDKAATHLRSNQT